MLNLPCGIESATGVNFSPGPFSCPDYAVIGDEIVRLTRKAPTPDRRLKGHRFAIEDQPPVGRAERRRYLLPAAAAAQVRHRHVLDRDVEHALVQPLRDVLDE